MQMYAQIFIRKQLKTDGTPVRFYLVRENSRTQKDKCSCYYRVYICFHFAGFRFDFEQRGTFGGKEPKLLNLLDMVIADK